MEARDRDGNRLSRKTGFPLSMLASGMGKGSGLVHGRLVAAPVRASAQVKK